MAKVNVDTKKLRECGNEIMKIAVEIGDTIDGLFNRIANMPVTTKEWYGPAATEFARRANIEKEDYVKVKSSISNYGKFLVSIADNYDYIIGKVRLK